MVNKVVTIMPFQKSYGTIFTITTFQSLPFQLLFHKPVYDREFQFDTISAINLSGISAKKLYLLQVNNIWHEYSRKLRYTKDHEWVSINENIATIGITDFAQGELGDIVYVEVETLDETFRQKQFLE